MEMIGSLITLLGGLFLTTFGILKLYGLNKRWVSGSNKSLKENLCGT